MRRGVSILKDHPGASTALVATLLGAHILAAHHWPRLDLSRYTRRAEELVAVYSGLAEVAALAAGFVGVLIVFSTLTGGSWSRIRNIGGKSLVRNWISPMRTTFIAALVSISASLLTQIGHEWIAWWFFEFAALMLISSISRILWLLSGLLTIQQNVDRETALKESQHSLASLGLEDEGPSSPARPPG